MGIYHEEGGRRTHSWKQRNIAEPLEGARMRNIQSDRNPGNPLCASHVSALFCTSALVAHVCRLALFANGHVAEGSGSGPLSLSPWKAFSLVQLGSDAVLIILFVPILYYPFKELYVWNHCMVSWWIDGIEGTGIGCWGKGSWRVLVISLL